MKFKMRKTMVNGNFLKVNGRFIKSIGYFAYDGCHKIYVLENRNDIENAMYYGYILRPIGDIKAVYNKSCPLKFIDTLRGGEYYVKQGQKARWSEVKATKKEIDARIHDDENGVI